MSKESRHLVYRLRLNEEEFDKLNKCSQHSGLKTSDFLRMLIDDYEYFMEENSGCQIQNNEDNIENIENFRDDWIYKINVFVYKNPKNNH